MSFNKQTYDVQKKLRDLGYKGANGLNLSIDGYWGKNTSYAVLNFQKAHGEVSNTGKLDSNTIKVLNYFHSKKIVSTSSKSVSTRIISAPVRTPFQVKNKFNISALMQNKAIVMVSVGILLIAILYPVIIKKKAK